MARNQLHFIRAGVFLLVQRLQMMVYRTLLRRMYVCSSARPLVCTRLASTHARRNICLLACSCTAIVTSTGRYKIDLTQVLSILQALGIDMDMEELLCLIANLKHMGAILCVMSFQPPYMALSPAGAFPRIADVTAKKEAPFGS